MVSVPVEASDHTGLFFLFCVCDGKMKAKMCDLLLFCILIFDLFYQIVSS